MVAGEALEVFHVEAELVDGLRLGLPLAVVLELELESKRLNEIVRLLLVASHFLVVANLSNESHVLSIYIIVHF